jgi:hypothetical protein
MSERRKLRIDMVFKKIEEVDREKGLFKFLAIPDPRVWQRKTVNGESGYWHKFDKIFLSDKELKKAAPTLKNKPVYVENIGLKNRDEYLRRSKNRIEQKPHS